MTRIRTRTQRFELRMTPAEKETWSASSAAVGLDLREYIRRCVELPANDSEKARG